MTFTLNPALPEEKGVELSTMLEKRIGCLSARDHEEMTYVSKISISLTLEMSWIIVGITI